LSRLKIFLLYTFIDLLIVAGALWCAFQHVLPIGKNLFAAATLFVLNGVWLVWMTLKNTPRTGAE
jgi:hypothetical protein